MHTCPIDGFTPQHGWHEQMRNKQEECFPFVYVSQYTSQLLTSLHVLMKNKSGVDLASVGDVPFIYNQHCVRILVSSIYAIRCQQLMSLSLSMNEQLCYIY